MDAANVDLKGFTEEFYRELTGSHLAPVLDTLRWLVHESNVWLEITNLLIPGKNDSAEEMQRMCAWIVEDLGPDVPLHFSAFHPDFRMHDVPPTPPATLVRAHEIAQSCRAELCLHGQRQRSRSAEHLLPRLRAGARWHATATA